MLGLLALAGAAITAGEIGSALITAGTVMCATQTIVDSVKELSEE